MALSWVKAAFNSSGLVESLGNVADKFHLSGEEKQKFQIDMEGIVTARENKIQDTLAVEMQAKERIIVAEMAQSDSFTKRARPTVVYAGLVFICINYVIAPWASHFAQLEVPLIVMPSEFWVAWGGIVATWSLGRSAEKIGMRNKIAGSKKSLLD